MGNKKDKKGTPYNNLEALTNCKEHFLNLTKMYSRLGHLFKTQASSLSHPLFQSTCVPKDHLIMLNQFNEMGEELKNVGNYLDLLGGKPVMREAEETPEEKKAREVKEGMEGKKIEKEREFVSNIAPKKEDENEEEK